MVHARVAMLETHGFFCGTGILPVKGVSWRHCLVITRPTVLATHGQDGRATMRLFVFPLPRPLFQILPTRVDLGQFLFNRL